MKKSETLKKYQSILDLKTDEGETIRVKTLGDFGSHMRKPEGRKTLSGYGCKRAPIEGGYREFIEDGLANKQGAAPVGGGRRRFFAKYQSSHYAGVLREKRLDEKRAKLGRVTASRGRKRR